MNSEPLPPVADRDTIQQRLRVIFPDGIENRGYCTREMAASTVFTMLYVGAIEGTGRFLAPKHVYRMTDVQARRLGDRDRLWYAEECLKPGFNPRGRRWYLDNTREPIRDETLRDGLVAIGASIVRPGVPTTSSRPRYALRTSFAVLFDPGLGASAFEAAAEAWRRASLSAGALMRVALAAQGGAAPGDVVQVTFPDGHTRQMAAGSSSMIAKAVIEVFAARFLQRPAVVLLSESQVKIIDRDERLVSRLRLRIEASGNLPDIVLADLGPQEPLLAFVEVVATDGAVTAERKAALLRIATDAGFSPRQVAFVTAYADRASTGFRRTVSRLAWGSFAWFASEPDNLLAQYEDIGGRTVLSDLVEPTGSH